MSVALDVGPLRADPAGVGIYVRSLAQALEEIGRRDVTYIGRRPDAADLPELRASRSRPTRLPYPLWVELFGDRDARRARSSVAHFTDGLVPLVRTRPTIVTVLDLSLVRHWRAHRWVRYPRIPLVLAAPRMADHVIAISQATADEVQRLTGVPARKIAVVPPAARPSARPRDAADVDAALRRYGLASSRFVLVPGTIEPRKNHLRVVHAFADLVRRSGVSSDTRLVLAGHVGWKAKSTIRAIRDSPVRDRIDVLGYVPEDDLAALMTAAAIVVYASTYEGFGLPVVEAMACGAVVVTSNVSSMPEAAGDAGILVDPFDVAAIGRGMEDGLRADAADRARSLARAAQFSWTATARATAAIYDALTP